MGRALELPGTNPVLAKHPSLKFQNGRYTYTVETRGNKTTYSVTDGTRTIALPVLWGFGAAAQTWVLEHDGKLYESLVSYYPDINDLYFTTGDEKLVANSLEDAIGRELSANESKTCFGCHSTNAIVNGKLDVSSLKPGVTCEHCHIGAIAHMSDIPKGITATIPPRLADLSTEDLSNFCGQCHRTWETVVRNHWFGPVNVRFQPYRLANSKCFNGTDPRISCLACHDPHQQVVRDDSYYDAKCQACHAAPAHAPPALAASSVPSCPVAKSNCVSCHMPKVKLPNGHLTFTDHQIRVVRAGESYPN